MSLWFYIAWGKALLYEKQCFYLPRKVVYICLFILEIQWSLEPMVQLGYCFMKVLSTSADLHRYNQALAPLYLLMKIGHDSHEQPARAELVASENGASRN